MLLILLLPLLFQALVIGVDEFVFHVKRGLPKWERIGHPLDTLTVLACAIYTLWVPYSPLTLKIYIGLALFSCLFVTKDEFVHKHHCPASEQWLHALLFVNHPIALAAMGLLWPLLSGVALFAWMEPLLSYRAEALIALLLQTSFSLLFLLYQLIYWNLVWKEQK
jgi:hypothetical protein